MFDLDGTLVQSEKLRNGHSVDGVLIGLGLSTWNTPTMYPVFTLHEAVDVTHEVGSPWI